MKIKTDREKILTPLLSLNSVVERRQTLPILSNILIVATGSNIECSATDMEVELVVRLENGVETEGSITVSARKLLDICRALRSEADILLESSKDKITITSGRSRFSLVTMAGEEFPSVGEFEADIEFDVDAEALRGLIARTQFAMAHQDVRYYLNGLLFEFMEGHVRAVATDGHRLAISDMDIEQKQPLQKQIIVPRKGVAEMARMLSGVNGIAKLSVSSNHLRISTEKQDLTSKLIDGRFPEYDRVVPKKGNHVVVADRVALKDGLSRASILSNERFKGIRLCMEKNCMRALAHNTDQEEAEETIDVLYAGAPMEIGFNVTYIIDALGALNDDQVTLEFTDANSSCLITGKDENNSRYVVMPMRL